MKTSHAQQRIPINPYWVGVSCVQQPKAHGGFKRWHVNPEFRRYLPNQVKKYKLVTGTFQLDTTFNGTGYVGKADRTAGAPRLRHRQATKPKGVTKSKYR